MNKYAAVMAVIADRGPVSGNVIARTSGIDNRTAIRILSNLHSRGHISREKPADGGYFKYFLSAKQADRHMRVRHGIHRYVMSSETIDITARLRFLKNLQQVSYGSNPVLREIIADYETTLRLRKAIDHLD